MVVAVDCNVFVVPGRWRSFLITCELNWADASRVIYFLCVVEDGKLGYALVFGDGVMEEKWSRSTADFVVVVVGGVGRIVVVVAEADSALLVALDILRV